MTGFFIVIFWFCAILVVMETQLLLNFVRVAAVDLKETEKVKIRGKVGRREEEGRTSKLEKKRREGEEGGGGGEGRGRGHGRLLSARRGRDELVSPADGGQALNSAGETL